MCRSNTASILCSKSLLIGLISLIMCLCACLLFVFLRSDVLVRWPVRRRGQCEPQCHEQLSARQTLGPDFLLRPRLAGLRPERVERRAEQREGCHRGVHQTRWGQTQQWTDLTHALVDWKLNFLFPLFQANGLAALGKYESSGTCGAAAQSLYVANHAY